MSEDASTAPQVTVKKDGPYIVSGSVPLRDKQPVYSEHGEPLTWHSDEPMDAKATYALCRCGESSNKPFCDGTHAKIDFDGTETAPTTTYEDRRQKLSGGTGITAYYDETICVHAGFCGNKKTSVWDMMGDTEDTQVRAQVMAMIERCPSGALTYEIDDVGPIEPDLPAEVSVVIDGPLWVSDHIPVERVDGDELEQRNRVTLCRCGKSDNKPLCDGTHKEAGFTG